MRMRELAVPAQALLAVLTCLGLMWMVYTMAFFDPNPPTAAEVHSLETQDPEMLVFRTAAAMTVDALLFGPTQILLPVTGPSLTPMPTSMLQASSLSTLVSLPTLTPTSTRPAWRTPTAHAGGSVGAILPSATPRTPTLTVVPTDPPTSTMQPSATPEPPTSEPSTETAVPPTVTQVTQEPPTPEPSTPTAEPPPIETTEPPPTEPVSTESAP